jgi:cytochrome b561
VNRLAVWTLTQRRLHWWTAWFVLLAFAIAWPMVGLSLRELLAKFLLYQAHKTLGLLVALMTLWRIGVRARHGRPAWETDLPPWQRSAAAGVHGLLYALLLIVPTLGYFTAATAPARVPTLFFLIIPVPHAVGANPAAFAILRQVHRALAIMLVGLATGHAGAALVHHRRGRATLMAMWRGVTRASAAGQPSPQ